MLVAVREAVSGAEDDRSSNYFKKDGLLYHRRKHAAGGGGEDSAVEQLVLPKKFRKAVLNLAHSVPTAGHLGKRKTADRILQRFHWPGVHRDVASYCKGCAECQKLSRGKVCRVPLVPLRVISVPFERIAMDIVGPLPRSSHGNRYVLVVCDYATLYPEAMAMRSVEAEWVAEELMTPFARVGIPKEILTDQGTNFTSMLLTTRTVSFVTHTPYSHKPLPPIDRRPRRAVQTNPEDDAKEDSGRRGQGLGPATIVRTFRISRGTPELHGILAFRAVVWTHTEGTVRRAEGDVGRKGEEFGECRVTHPDDVGQNGGDEGARDGKHGKGTDNTEEVVRSERPVQRAESWQQGVGPTSFVHKQAAHSVARAV